MKKPLYIPETNPSKIDLSSFKKEKEASLQKAKEKVLALAAADDYKQNQEKSLKAEMDKISKIVDEKTSEGCFKFCVPLELNPGKMSDIEVLYMIQQVYSDVAKVMEDKNEALSLDFTLTLDNMKTSKGMGLVKN